jgi:tripartite-type tricarboxylate transporter receptor subunit TctC
MTTRLSMLFPAMIALLGAASTPAYAEWPERAVTLIVPWAAGGGTDATARALANELEVKFGQPFNVINRTGGAGYTGHFAIADAPSDGYTLGIVTTEIAMFEAQGMEGVSSSDFTLIAQYNSDPFGISVSADVEYNDLASLIAAVQAAPGSLKASGAARGGLPHLAWSGLLDRMDLDVNASPWVSSDGAAPAMQQLGANAIDVLIVSPAEVDGLVRAGQAHTVAIIADKRSQFFPDIPTVNESLGVDWAPMPFRGIAGPSDMPKEVVDKLTAAVEEILQKDEFVSLMQARNFSIVYLDQAAFTAAVATQEANLAAALALVGQ